MLHVICLNANDYQGRGAEYVNKLHDAVTRNLPAGFAGQFECFTDNAMGLDPHIIARPLPERGVTGWWNKLALFKEGLFPDGDRVLYFDLDTLITGRLDDIAAYDGEFAALRDAYRPDGLQSSVMAWRVGSLACLFWEKWDKAGRPKVDGGDQAWIEETTTFKYADCLQDKFPDLLVSYKATAGAIPAKASVVFFHGHPRPHEVTTGWVPEVWKIGGLMRAQLDTICNVASEKLFANVRTNSQWVNVPWLDYAEAHDGHVVIVGGGPSVVGCLDEIRWRQSIGQKVWALNGAAAWLRKNGIIVGGLIIADARPENVRFIHTFYEENAHHFIASQCDPAVLDEVCGGREVEPDVTLWHSNAPGVADLLKKDEWDEDETRPVHLIGGGSTVGLSAMVIAQVRGYRTIHLYGFDSSLSHDQHHAYPQSGNDTDMVVDVLAGDQKFRCAPWMVQQAQEFVTLARWLMEEGCTITVAGDGLLPTLARDMMLNPQPTAAQQRAHAVLERLPAGPVVGAEIGVFKGAMSKALLQGRDDLTLYMIDSWEGQGAAYEGNSGDWHATLTQAAQDGYKAAANLAVAFAGYRARFVWARSGLAASATPDGSLDFVFIDGDHSYEGCRADIEAWVPALKPGGLLCGHDYENPDFPQFGVKRAVDEYAAARGLTLELGANLTWFLRLPLAAAKAA